MKEAPPDGAVLWRLAVGGPWHADTKLTMVVDWPSPSDLNRVALRKSAPYSGIRPVPIKRYGEPEGPLDCPVVWDTRALLVHEEFRASVESTCGNTTEILDTSPIPESLPIPVGFVVVHPLQEVDCVDLEWARYRIIDEDPENRWPQSKRGDFRRVDRWTLKDDLPETPPLFHVARAFGEALVTTEMKDLLESFGPNFVDYQPMPRAREEREFQRSHPRPRGNC